MKRLAAIIFMFLAWYCNLVCQELNPPITQNRVTCDFGPRLLDDTLASRFHKGIDYNPWQGAPIGRDFFAVNGGQINRISFRSGLKQIEVKTSPLIMADTSWGYLHIFHNKGLDSLLDTALCGRFKMGKYINPLNTRTQKAYIARYTDSTLTTLEKVFIDTIVPDTFRILGLNPTRSVTSDEVICATGKSGTTTPHLHLWMNEQRDNPLSYIRRPSTPNYTINIIHPNDKDDGKIDTTITVNAETLTRRIVTKITSNPSFDHDKVIFYLDTVAHTNLIDSFSLGGRPGEVWTTNARVSLEDTNTYPRTGVYAPDNGLDYYCISPWNTTGIVNGNHRIICRVFNVRDTLVASDTIDIVLENGPQVTGTIPDTNALDVPVDGWGIKNGGAQITIFYNRPMDTSSVNANNIIFDPALRDSFTIGWNNRFTEVTITLADNGYDLQYFTLYTITLKDSIKDSTGAFLDGDFDNNPGGDYKFQFTTRSPQISFSGNIAMFGPRPQSKSIPGTLTNLEYRTLELAFSDTSGNANGGDGDWSYEIICGLATLDPQETKDINLVQLSHNVSGSGDYTVPIIAYASPVTKSTSLDGEKANFIGAAVDSGGNGNGGSGFGSGPGRDFGIQPAGPDDNWSVSDPLYSTPWLVDTKSDVGLLLSGYCSSAGHLLGKYGIATGLVSATGLRVISEDVKELNDIKVLIVPSGGLRDKLYDNAFWQGLEAYVSNGGHLVVLDQPYGYLYSRLPGSPQARGWEEDLSCTGLFTRLGTWHPAMSGQSEQMLLVS